MKEIIFASVRHGIAAGAGALVTRGVFTNSETETLIGAVMILLNWAWMHYAKKQADPKAAEPQAPAAQ